jgi:hypothetical protein
VAAAGGGSFREIMDVEIMRPTEQAAYRQGRRTADTVRRPLHLDQTATALAA